MDSKAWFFFLLGIAIITSLFFVARLVLGILTVSKAGGHVENRFGIGLILNGIAGILSAFLNTQLYLRAIDAFSDYGSVNPSVISTISIFSMIFSLMGVAASFLEADYCFRKYGARIRLIYIIFTVINMAVSFLTGFVSSRLADIYVLTPFQVQALAYTSSLLSLGTSVLFLVTYVRYRNKENVFRNIFVFNILSIASSVIMLTLRLLSVSSATTHFGTEVPAIVLELISLTLGLLGPVKAFYIFYCVNKAKNNGYFDKTDSIQEGSSI